MNRLRQDFHLALVVMFGIVGIVMVLPFAVYRLLDGQLLSGWIDVLVVVCVSIGALHAYRHGNTAAVALFLAVSSSLGCVAFAYIGGPDGPLWLHGVVLTNFLLVERKRAAIISAIGIAAVAASALALPELAHKASFIGSSVVICAFAYIFVWRTDLQRKQLENLALRDPLTGASNRRAMKAELDIAMAMNSRNGKPLGMIIFDLDHFKQINDRYGHDAGDNVLVEVANVVRRTTRRSDRFFRLGGEEFALLIPATNASDLREIAEKVRLAIECEVSCGESDITTSLGGSYLRIGETACDWRARTDAAMYRAKHEGRNRTVIDELVVDDKRAPIRTSRISKASKGAARPSRMHKDVEVRRTVEPPTVSSPRTSGSRRLHNDQSMVEERSPMARRIDHACLH